MVPPPVESAVQRPGDGAKSDAPFSELPKFLVPEARSVSEAISLSSGPSAASVAYDALPHAAMRQAYGLALGTAEDLEARTRHVRFPQSVLPSGSLCFRFARLVPGTVR